MGQGCHSWYQSEQRITLTSITCFHNKICPEMNLKRRIGSLRKSLVREALEGILGYFQVTNNYWLFYLCVFQHRVTCLIRVPLPHSDGCEGWTVSIPHETVIRIYTHALYACVRFPYISYTKGDVTWFKQVITLRLLLAYRSRVLSAFSRNVKGYKCYSNGTCTHGWALSM